MQPESAKLLTDISDAATQIVLYTKGKSRDDFLTEKQLRDAVQWNFAVIGEALSKLQKIDPETARRIGEWNRVIAFRNQLIHGYGVIKNEITWDIVEKKIPVLRSDVHSLLSISDSDPC